MYQKRAKRINGHISRLLVVVMIVTMCPIIGIMFAETASASTVLQNDSLSVQIGNIGQIEVFNIRNNRDNRSGGQPNFVMPNTESNLSGANHQYMGELIFSTRAAETVAGLAAEAYAEQDINKTLAAAPAGAMTQYSNMTDANLAANPNINIDYGDNKITVDYKGFALNHNAARTMKGYDVRQEWDVNTPDDSLMRTITVKNVSDQYIEFGDMGLPMPWNNKYNSRAASYNDRVMVHNFAGADSGYTQIVRPSGEGNFLIFAPVPASGARIEYVEYVQSRANFQGVSGYRSLAAFGGVYGGLGGDDGGWQPGMNILFQHAKNVYAGNGGAYMPVSTFTSKILAPGEEMTYQYKYFAVRAGDNSPQENASSPNNASDSESERETNMRSILYQNGMIDMLALPSFSTFLNMPTKLDLHYDDSRITDVQVNIMSVYENDPYDLAHIPNGNPYNVNNSRGGRGLQNAPENAAYARSVSESGRTVDERGEAHHIYDLSFDTIGNNSVGISYKLDGVSKYTEAEFSVMPEIEAVIDAHAAFNYDNRVTSGQYTGQYREYTMHGAVSSNTQSADDWGWDQGNFMAMKNLLRPNQAEITSLESLLIDLYWGKPLINHSTYAVSNAFSGSGSRVFTHQMAATNFFTMYQIMKAYPELTYRAGYDALWYLDIAYNIYNQRVVTSTSTGYYGEQFIEPLIEALRAEGRTTQANTLQARFTGTNSGKGYTMATASYPYGSEFPFDNTGEEGAYFAAKALRTYAPAHAQYSRAYQNMLLAEWKTRACRGLQPTWFHYGNVVFIGGEGWWNSQYTTPLAGAIMDDYIRFQDNGYSDDEIAWAERINYAAKVSSFSHVNMGQIASTAIGNISWRYNAFKGRFGAMNVNDQNGNRLQYNGWNDFSGEADENLYGSLLRLSTDIVTDPVFGLYAYGGAVTDNGGSYTVTPLDGISKKINLMNEKIYLEFNRDEVRTATIGKLGTYMTFELNNQTGTGHITQLSLTGLSEDGTYYVVKEGTRTPISSFTVTDGAGIADISMAATDTSVTLLIILATDYNLTGPTVLADIASQYAYKDAPIELAGEVFNADEYDWSVQDAPNGADYDFTDDDTLNPTFTADTAGEYVVRLTATDSDAVTSYIDIEIEVIDRATLPAPAVTTATVESGDIFPGFSYRLTSAATTGIPGGGLTYRWTGPTGAAFSDADIASPTVEFDDPGTYALTLTVTDDIGRTATDTVNVTVLPLSAANPPEITAATIVSGKIFPGYSYQLTGNATTGIPGGSVAYEWSAGEGVAFSDANVASPTVMFDEPGTYALTLTVTDDIERTSTETVNVTVLPLSESDPPEITNVGIDATLPVVDSTYGLLGMASTGIPGSSALSYQWTSFPAAGVAFTGTGANSAFPTVLFTIPRTYDLTLTVTDAIGRSVSETFAVIVAENITPNNVALSTKGATLQNIHQNGAARTAPLNGGSTARAAASTLNTWGTSSSATRHWFQLTLADEVTLYAVDIMWSSDAGGTQPPAASTSDATRNMLMVPAASPAVPMANDALTVPAANWTRLSMTDKAGAAIVDVPRVTNGSAANNVWNFAGFEPVDTQYLLMVLNRPGSGNGVGLNYWRAYALEPAQPAEDVYIRVTGNELDDAAKQAEVFPAYFETGMKKIDFATGKYVYLDHDIALKWTAAQITAARNAAVGDETIVTGTNSTLGYNLRVHVVKGAAAPEVVGYDPVDATAGVGGSVILPDTVVVNLDDGSKQTLAVTWDIPVDLTDTPGPKTVDGTVVLPSGWTGSDEVTATVTVVENPKSYLGNILAAFEAMDEDAYTVESYEAAELVYEAAKRVYEYNEALYEEVTQATDDLNAALSAMRIRADAWLLGLLQDYVDEYGALSESDYEPAYWDTFSDALDAVQALLDDPDNAGYNEAIDAITDLVIAVEDLLQHRVVDKSMLQQAIAIAEAELAQSDKYIPISIANLTDKLNAARAVNADTSATQATVDSAFYALTAALTDLHDRASKAALQVLVNLASLNREANYTPITWAPFADALDDARDVLNDTDLNVPQMIIDEAYNALNTALRDLVRKANFAGLQSVVNRAQAIVDNINDYVPSSVDGLAAELTSARAVLNNANATQAQVDAAATALNTKVMQAKLRPDRSALLAMYYQATSLSFGGYTQGSVTVLMAAINEAAAVLNGSDEVITQEMVDVATANLRNAINALVATTADAAPIVPALPAAPAVPGAIGAGIEGGGIVDIPATDTPLADAPGGNGSADAPSVSEGIDIAQGDVPLASGGSDGISPALAAILSALAATLICCFIFFLVWKRRRKDEETQKM